MPFSDSLFLGLIHNGAILIAVTIVYDYFWKRDPDLKSLKNQLFVGLLIGSASFIIMRTTWVMEEGTVFDTRSVLLSVSGLFFGVIPTIIGATITAIIRIINGGAGVYMGVMVIVCSALIGIVWRKYLYRKLSLSYFLEILIFSLVVHIAMLGATVLLPHEIRFKTLSLIWIPTLVIYPFFTLLFSFFLVKRAQFWKIDQILRSEKAKLRNYFLMAPDSIFICDKKGTLIQHNPKFEILFNISKNEKSNIELTSFIDPEYRSTFLELLESTDGPEQHKSTQILFHHPMKQAFHGLVGLTSLNDKEFIGIIKDIDEIITTQSELIIAKERAEESDRLKSMFLSSMNHEIRTPLNAVIGFSDLLKNDPDPSVTVDYAEIINQNGYSLLQIFESVFELAKLKSDGSSSLTLSLFAIDPYMQTVFELAKHLKSKLPKKSIQIELNGSTDKPDLSILTDRNKLNLLFKNLIENALRFTNEGKVTINYKTTDESLIISIEDTGSGIPTDKQKIIFDAFRKADENNTGNHPGLGLGLTICIEIVSLLKGQLELISNPNHGSKFIITIPLFYSE